MTAASTSVWTIRITNSTTKFAQSNWFSPVLIDYDHLYFFITIFLEEINNINVTHKVECYLFYLFLQKYSNKRNKKIKIKKIRIHYYIGTGRVVIDYHNIIKVLIERISCGWAIRATISVSVLMQQKQTRFIDVGRFPFKPSSLTPTINNPQQFIPIHFMFAHFCKYE